MYVFIVMGGGAMALIMVMGMASDSDVYGAVSVGRCGHNLPTLVTRIDSSQKNKQNITENTQQAGQVLAC